MNKAQGFTLIEVMVVVAIVGILFAIVLPSYENHIQKSRRVDAKSALMDLSARQERYMGQKKQYYAGDVSVANGLNFGRTTSAEGHYSLTSTACSSGVISNCYLLTAQAIGIQAQDTDCPTFTLNSAGVKTPTTGCW